jgi:hypothetical protein
MPLASTDALSVRRLLAIFAVGVSQTLAACTSNRGRMPREWGPVVLATHTRCPSVAGRYMYTGQPTDYELAARVLPDGGEATEPEYFEIAGSADTALHVTTWYVDGRHQERRLQKGAKYSGDFFCDDGWLQLGDGSVSARFDEEVASQEFFAKRRAMRIAIGRGGAIVARLDRTDYDEFTVWCGDGCKGIPLPWTFTTRSTWSRSEPWLAGKPKPSSAQRAPDDARTAAAEAEQRDQRLLREIALLENGPPATGEADVRKRVTAALAPGMLLIALTEHGTRWHASVEFDEPAQLMEFMERLPQSGAVAELGRVPRSQNKSSNGRWTDVVYLRYEP